MQILHISPNVLPHAKAFWNHMIKTMRGYRDELKT